MSGKILIVGAAWIGDMAMAQSLFMTLKIEAPDTVLDVLAPAWTIPLLERMPEIRRAIRLPVDRGELSVGARRALGRSLRAEAYDQAIVLPNSFKSALVPWFAGIRRRTGWNGEMRIGLINDRRTLDKAALPRMIDRFNALAFPKGRIKRAADFPYAAPLPHLEVDSGQAEAARQRLGLTENRLVLALCPGAEFGPAKRWPPAKYAELAAARIAQGWQVWMFGSAKDAEGCEQVLAALPPEQKLHGHNLAGRTSLAEAVDLLSLCGLVVTNDSGLMHVAAALGRPLVALYGPTSPGFTPPLSTKSRVVSLNLSCSPCFKRTCPLGHHNCMEQLPSSLAAAECDSLIAA